MLMLSFIIYVEHFRERVVLGIGYQSMITAFLPVFADIALFSFARWGNYYFPRFQLLAAFGRILYFVFCLSRCLGYSSTYE